MKTLFLSIVLSFIVCVFSTRQGNVVEGIDVHSIHANIQNSSDFRSQLISADITGHTLTIEFNEDVNKAQVIIRNNYGFIVEQETVTSTPDIITFIINDTGHYRMEVILINGDQYYGDFQVAN